jgi:hypothetical protein
MENTGRQVKDALYAQVTRIGKAMCSPKRLELIELLCQGEKPVERLAAEAEISMKLASAHLKELRQAHLVEPGATARTSITGSPANPWRISGWPCAPWPRTGCWNCAQPWPSWPNTPTS